MMVNHKRGVGGNCDVMFPSLFTQVSPASQAVPQAIRYCAFDAERGLAALGGFLFLPAVTVGSTDPGPRVRSGWARVRIPRSCQIERQNRCRSKCQTECQKEIQNICQKDPERMSDRISACVL